MRIFCNLKMLHCKRIYVFFSIWMLLLLPGMAHSDEDNAGQDTQPKMCWVDIQNQPNAQAQVPCDWTRDYSITWEGDLWKINDHSSVIDGQGFITLHRKDGFQSVKYLSTWQKGYLDSGFNLDPGKFFRCVDDKCEQVELQIDRKTLYRGTITFNSGKTDFDFSGNGRVTGQKLVFDGDITKGMADGLGKICIAPQGLSLPNLPEDFDEDDCGFPNLFADGFWESTTFVNGYIRQLYQNGVVYEGGFSEGLIENWGTIRWPDGAAYRGDLDGGKRNGKGRYHYPDGSVYEGEWKDGLKSDAGVLWIKPKQIRYIGEWSQGKFHGDGIMEFANKSVLIGTFFNGKPNGECLFLSASKEQFQTIWKNGQLIFFRPAQNSKTSVSFNFEPIQSAHADGFFSGLSDAAKTIKAALIESVNTAADFVKEVIEHPEYMLNAAKGCVAGGTAAAITGAAGGAVGGAAVGAAMGFIAGGIGAVPGAAAGAVLRGVAVGTIEGISGCLTQGAKAYAAKKAHGKDFSWSNAKQAFNEEFTLEHFAYGAMEGGLLALFSQLPVAIKAIKGTSEFSALAVRATRIFNKVKRITKSVATAAQLFFCKIEQTLIFLSGEELHAHHRTG